MSVAGNAPLPIAFVAFQTDNRANGGITSLSHIVRQLDEVAPLMITQRETDVTRGWREQGYDVRCWAMPSPFPLDGEPPSSRLERGIAFATINLQLRELFRRSRVRLVHCNDFPSMSIAAPAARSLGIPVVHNIRDTLGVGGAKWKLSRIFADRIVVLSQEMRAIVESQLKLPTWVPESFRAPIEVVYSIVDPTRMRPPSFDERARLRAKLGLGQDEFSIGVVAAVVEKKQQRELLSFLDRNPGLLPENAKVHFVGDFRPDLYGYARECQALSRSPALEKRVRFEGYTDAIDEWYQSLDCTLITSSHEGLARSMVESVACGTPVVSFDVCSAREILTDHACGEVVAQGDFAELFRRARQGVEQPSEWQRWAARGPLVAAELFSPAAVAAGYQQIYRRLLAKPEAKRSTT